MFWSESSSSRLRAILGVSEAPEKFQNEVPSGKGKYVSHCNVIATAGSSATDLSGGFHHSGGRWPVLGTVSEMDLNFQ